MADYQENFGEKNLAIVERAKKAYAEGHYEKAIKLFERSIEICESQNWTDGVRYATGMIEDAEEMLKLQKEEEQLLAHEHEQELEEQEVLLEKEEPHPTEISKTPDETIKPELERIPKEEIKPKKTAQISNSSDEIPILIQKGSGRLTCPKCGNSQRNMIREVVDKSHIIMDYPLIYGKKYICGKCGTHWRRAEE
ncbi:MAG: hypothetical protein ACTSWC_08505 [Promethearchaeota archaeon]